MLPYRGVVQITTKDGTKNVCFKSLKGYYASKVFCRHLGYQYSYTHRVTSPPRKIENTTFLGSITCNNQEKYLSQCSITASARKSCSHLTYIECKFT